jgi:hypothetical protein
MRKAHITNKIHVRNLLFHTCFIYLIKIMIGTLKKKMQPNEMRENVRCANCAYPSANKLIGLTDFCDQKPK